MLNKDNFKGLNTGHMSKLETGLGVFRPCEQPKAKRDTDDQLEAKIDEADNLLKEKLDVLMDLAGITKPELLNQYTAARVIVDR